MVINYEQKDYEAQGFTVVRHGPLFREVREDRKGEGSFAVLMKRG